MQFFARFCLRLIFLIIFLAGAGAAGIAFFLFQGEAKEAIEVIVPRGASLAQVSQELERLEVIRYGELFKYVLRFTGGATKVRAGEFRFKKDMKIVDALFVLYNSEPILHQLTVPEGWNVRQIASAVATAKLGEETKFLSLALSKETADKLKINASSVEGYLFPDTYFFSRIEGEERIIHHMVQRFRQKFGKDYETEMQQKGWKLENLVILASIIEKETGVKHEREIISSVFHNRLKKKMRLQSDPTTIYGIPNFNGNITKADLLRYSPYNTYVIPALPIGPIANPGLDSLVAALRPATTNYLFFVSNNKGGHIFSETYGQHTRHVDTFQKSPTTRRSTPKQVARDKKK